MTVPAVVAPVLDPSIVESVLLQGDLSRLTPPQRVAYYNRVCESLGLNPLTKPFDYLTLNGKTVLYAKRDATEQLRKIHGVSIVELNSREVGGVFVVTAKAQDKQQRIDVSTGAVPIANLKGDALANALMKAETKAKRRVTLSICGLGLLDESEVETIPRAAVQAVAEHEAIDTTTGEIVEAPAQQPLTNELPADTQYTGLYTATTTRKKGAVTIHDLLIDGQKFSLAEPKDDEWRKLEGRRVTITYRAIKGGMLLTSLVEAALEELPASEIPF